MNLEMPLRPGDDQRAPVTLLDYFAGQVIGSTMMQAALAETPRPEGWTLGQHAASIAYAIAHRMLAERSK